MNVKVLGGGAVVLLGVGGFLVYNEVSTRREAKKREAEAAQDAEVKAERKKFDDERSNKEPVWATVPDLKGKTEGEARTVLTEAGFLAVDLKVMEDRYECEYDAEPRSQSDMVPVDTICDQEPEPGGRLRGEKLALKVVIQHDTYEHGGLAHSEWRRMPDLMNLSLAEAQALLATKGFGADEFEVEDYTSSCPPSKVCETVPSAGKRKHKDHKGVIRASLK